LVALVEKFAVDTNAAKGITATHPFPQTLTSGTLGF